MRALSYLLALLTVNALTLSRFFGAWLIVSWQASGATWHWIASIVVVFFLTDLDGMLARWWKVETAFGKFVDPFADKAICWATTWAILQEYGHAHGFLVMPFVLLTAYDIGTISLRLCASVQWLFSLPQIEMPNHPLAKHKTAFLMFGLVAWYVNSDEDIGMLVNMAGFVALYVAMILAFKVMLDYFFEYPKKSGVVIPFRR